MKKVKDTKTYKVYSCGIPVYDIKAPTIQQAKIKLIKRYPATWMGLTVKLNKRLNF